MTARRGFRTPASPLRLRSDRRLQDLAQLPLFRRMTPEELRRFVRRGDVVTLPASSFLAREHDPRPQFVVILKGRARASRGGRTIAELGPGDHYGELMLVADRAEPLTVRAVSEVEVFVMSRRDFTSALRDTPGLTFELFRRTAERLQRAAPSGSGRADE